MNAQQLRKLPFGYADFESIIQENLVYVDKTSFIYQIITHGKYYFLSRPRRFGKSLLLSTLRALFSGKKELFKNLAIYKTDYAWKKYPVIRIDFSGVNYSTLETIEKSLASVFLAIADEYNIHLAPTLTAKDLFRELINKLSHTEKVVILIDEYDKPILDHIDDPNQAKTFRDFLRNIYVVMKSCDEHLKFVFLTGVTKFSQTSIFSGLNNLEDLTFDPGYAALAGYTHEELLANFTPHIQALATAQNKSFDDAVQDLQNYYDGYVFAPNGPKMFNPFSILGCLKKSTMAKYWFRTGTPTFLIALLQKNNYELDSVIHPSISEDDLDSFDVDNMPLVLLLLQAGYLTIESYEQNISTYQLKIPNKEVHDGLIRQLAKAFTQLPSERATHYARLLTHALFTSDMTELQHRLQELFDAMPYTVQVKNEYQLQTVLFAMFALIGVSVDPEVATHKGRVDLIVTLPKRVYIVELKYNKTAHAALEQIQEKEYSKKYLNSDKVVTLLGINFDYDAKMISVAAKTL